MTSDRPIMAVVSSPMAKPLLEGGGVELALLHVRALNEMFQEGCLCLVLGQPSACQLVG
ncbi:MAG: hypothetical protein IJ546_03260 [Prevotella sp.]|nr:hypothetical protein [Prevotella sp.]